MVLELGTSLMMLGVTLGNANANENENENENEKTLRDVVAERPYPEYAQWWTIGGDFASFMSEAIVSEWSALPGNENEEALGDVESFFTEYIQEVYGREGRPSLVRSFIDREFIEPLQSGEFDALSYAFFRSAFQQMRNGAGAGEPPLEQERRSFTRRVGAKFFAQLSRHLDLDLPEGIHDEASFELLQKSIDRVADFLNEQGYFRDHVAFRFDIELEREGRRIVQSEVDFVEALSGGRTGYALFEMGYPVILPSAVYLFHTLGEAQHHSSRTIEELFGRVGVDARETADFDPIGYPSDMVVEVWEIRAKR